MSTPTILIQSLIRRAGGSKIDLAGKIYHFAPKDPSDPDAIHVCDVPADDAAAIHRFRAIREGYKILSDEADLPPAPKAPIGQTIAADKAAVAPAEAPPPATPIFITSPAGEQIELTAMDREVLVAFAKQHFDIKAHHKWTDATLISKILEAARGEE